MAKFKPARRKGRSSSTRPAGGIPCVILVFAVMVLVGFILYFVMKYANG